VVSLPEGNPLAVDGKITLAEPYKLTQHAAFLAGDGIGRVYLEVHFVVGGFAAQHLVSE